MKKNNKLALIALVTVLALVFAGYAFTASALILGDLNGDGKVRAADARMALRAAAGLETLDEDQKIAADVNFDKKVTAADARIILRVAANLQEMPEAPEKPSEPTDPTKPTNPVDPKPPADEGLNFAKDTNNGAGDGSVNAAILF